MGTQRKALREITVQAPAWADGNTRLREPTFKSVREARRIADDDERVAFLLGQMVLGEDGQPVGMDAIDAAGPSAIMQLAQHINPLMGEGEESPLGTTTSSSTASPLPSAA